MHLIKLIGTFDFCRLCERKYFLLNSRKNPKQLLWWVVVNQHFWMCPRDLCACLCSAPEDWSIVWKTNVNTNKVQEFRSWLQISQSWYSLLSLYVTLSMHCIQVYNRATYETSVRMAIYVIHQHNPKAAGGTPRSSESNYKVCVVRADGLCFR